MAGPDYEKRARKATAFVRKHVYVGVGADDHHAQAMWQKLAKEGEKTFSTANATAKLSGVRLIEKVVGPDLPATDYPATDYPATDYVTGEVPGDPAPPRDAAQPPDGGFVFYTALATYTIKKKAKKK
jgi:hypothetical protein